MVLRQETWNLDEGREFGSWYVRLKQAAGFMLPFKSRVHRSSRCLTDPGEDFLLATTHKSTTIADISSS